MRHLFIILLVLLSLCGCSAIYVNPGQNPATLRVHAHAALDPQAVDDFMQTRVLSPVEYWDVKWRGVLQGPWWGIKAYMRDAKGQLHPLLSTKSNIFEGQTTYQFSGYRDFIIPSGSYAVEVWLEAYMNYCTDVMMMNCGTPTLRIWRQELAENQFAPGQHFEANIDGGQADTNKSLNQ